MERELAAQINHLKAENSHLAASLKDALNRIQKLEESCKQAPFPMSEAHAMAEMLGPLNQETSITWMLRAANSLPPSANGFHLTQIARCCMSPLDRNKLEETVMCWDLLSIGSYPWMSHILSLLWPGKRAWDLYYEQGQRTNEDPEAYLARKKLLAKICWPSGERKMDFISELYNGLHPKSKEVLDSLETSSYEGLDTYLGKLKCLSHEFRLKVAKRKEKAQAIRRENKKKNRESFPRRCFPGSPKSPTQRKMETSKGPSLPKRQQLPETLERVPSPQLQGPETSNSPTNLRKANPHSPHRKENVFLPSRNTPAAVRTTVRKQEDNGHAPYEHPGGKRVKIPGNVAWIKPENPKLCKPSQAGMPQKGNPRGHSSHPRGLHWNGSGRCIPRMNNIASVTAQPLDQEVSDTVSASDPEGSFRKGLLETAL